MGGSTKDELIQRYKETEVHKGGRVLSFVEFKCYFISSSVKRVQGDLLIFLIHEIEIE